MEISVDRKWKKETYTVGRLYVNGKFYCNTIEDKDRGLYCGQGLTYIREHKVYAETAIPSGRYKISLSIVSGSFGKRKYYKDFCQGKLPRLLDVPGFDGILIHRGANASHSAGCLIVGDNTIKGGVTNSQERFEGLYKLMQEAIEKGEEVWITIG